MNVLLIEDEFIIAKDIQLLLEHKKNANVIITKDFEESNVAFQNNKFEVIISDINLNTKKDGIEIVTLLNSIRKTPVVFLTAYSDAETIKRAEKVLPFAYILKPFNNNQLLLTIELAIQNFQKRTNGNFKPENNKLLKHLTLREKEVLVVLCSGKLCKEIADQLNISNRTVEKHIENIKSKLEMHTNGELINFAMTTKILNIDV